MPTPPQEEVRNVLSDYGDSIVEIVRGAWEDWSACPQSGVWRKKRSRANFIWEQIIDRAHQAFDELAQIRIVESNETFLFVIDDRVLFRFKKGDEFGLSANLPTQGALAFHDHEQDLFGLPKVHRVEVVYQLNALETDIRDVLVVGRDERRVSWTFSLLNTEERVVSMPVFEPAESTKPAAGLVRARNDHLTKKRESRD